MTTTTTTTTATMTAAAATTDARNPRAARLPEEGRLPAPRIYVRAVEEVLSAWKADREVDQGGPSAAISAVVDRYREAEEALRDLLRQAPWGQSGSVFMTDRALSPGGDVRVKTLHVNGRERARLTGDHLEVSSAEEAEETYQRTKNARKAAEAAYQESLVRAVTALIKVGATSPEDSSLAGSDWHFVPSDPHFGRGGRLATLKESEMSRWGFPPEIVEAVSARGAFRRAEKIRRGRSATA